MVARYKLDEGFTMQYFYYVVSFGVGICIAILIELHFIPLNIRQCVRKVTLIGFLLVIVGCFVDIFCLTFHWQIPRMLWTDGWAGQLMIMLGCITGPLAATNFCQKVSR